MEQIGKFSTHPRSQHTIKGETKNKVAGARVKLMKSYCLVIAFLYKFLG